MLPANLRWSLLVLELLSMRLLSASAQQTAIDRLSQYDWVSQSSLPPSLLAVLTTHYDYIILFDGEYLHRNPGATGRVFELTPRGISTTSYLRILAADSVQLHREVGLLRPSGKWNGI